MGTFVTVVLKDYVRMLLGINRENTTWTLPINQVFSATTKKDIPKATCNQCSIEFNFIYRWHSAISQEDEKWIEELFKDLEKRLGSDWMDKRLGSRLPARIPAFDQERDDMARELGVCTLNELRKLCNLRPYRTFEEMNDDEVIATALRELYDGDVANVELYPGLVAEQVKPQEEATGLCAGCTITHAVLSDAVALVRGDRFLTTELNPYNLTQWGYDETQADNR